MELLPIFDFDTTESTIASGEPLGNFWGYSTVGLYQVGHFPGDRWDEWNGRYRDEVRQFVRGDAALVGAVALRLTGSSDIYEARGGSPLNSINFVTWNVTMTCEV